MLDTKKLQLTLDSIDSELNYTKNVQHSLVKNINIKSYAIPAIGIVIFAVILWFCYRKSKKLAIGIFVISAILLFCAFVWFRKRR